MRDLHISLIRNASLTESDERLLEYLLANLPPSCRVWPAARITQSTVDRFYQADLLLLGHYSLYVVEHKSPRPQDTGFIHDAHHQAQRYAHLLAAAIDGSPPGPRPWIEPVVVLSSDPPDARPSLPFLLDPAELVRAASGEHPGSTSLPPRAPLDADTREAIRRALDEPDRWAELMRLRQRLLISATPVSEHAASWVITTCFLLLAEARGWTPPRTGTAGVRDSLLALADLPCVRAMLPADVPPLSALPETTLRTLYASLHPLVLQALDDWGSSASAWPDLYKLLPSAEQREAHATLPTPSFISNFLCDQTLDPAIDTFGALTVQVLDPACGPGTTLCAAFHRLADACGDPLNALGRVTGIDIDPIAALISRLRLLTAYLERASPTQTRSPATPAHPCDRR